MRVGRKEEEPGTEGRKLVRMSEEGCQALESGPRGSLRASRVFTNEGSKKEKRGWKGRSVSYKGTTRGKRLTFPSRGEAIPGVSGCPSVQRRGDNSSLPCSDSPSEAPLKMGIRGARTPLKESRESGLERESGSSIHIPQNAVPRVITSSSLVSSRRLKSREWMGTPMPDVKIGVMV